MKKTISLALAFMFNITTTMAAQPVRNKAQPVRSTDSVELTAEEIIESIDDVSVASAQSQNNCDISEDPNIAIIDSMLQNEKIQRMSKQEFIEKMLSSLDVSHRQLARQARRILEPRAVFEGRRDARARRRLARVASRISSRVGEEVNVEEVRQRLQDDMNPEVQSAERAYLEAEIASDASAVEFLERVKALAVEQINQDCAVSKTSISKGISRGIASEHLNIMSDSCGSGYSIGGHEGMCRGPKLTLITLTVLTITTMAFVYGGIFLAAGLVGGAAGLMTLGAVTIFTFVMFFVVRSIVRNRSDVYQRYSNDRRRVPQINRD